MIRGSVTRDPYPTSPNHTDGRTDERSALFSFRALFTAPRRPVLALSSGARAMPACAPRKVYIDLGVNWCNTLRLHLDLTAALVQTNGSIGRAVSGWSTQDGHDWHVFGFEASPLIWSYADEFVKWLNGKRPDKPESCLPPAGSTVHLMNYATAYGCSAVNRTVVAVRECMFHRLARPLAALRPATALNDTDLRASRLARAQDCAAKPGFTLVPAAAGDADGFISLYSPPRQLIRGGAKDLRRLTKEDQRVHDLSNGIKIIACVMHHTE